MKHRNIEDVLKAIAAILSLSESPYMDDCTNDIGAFIMIGEDVFCFDGEKFMKSDQGTKQLLDKLSEEI